MIIFIIITAYVFIVTLTFKVLEIKKIGIQDYWYEGDKDAIWAIPAILISTFWIVTLPVMLMSKLADMIIQSFISNNIK